MPFIDSEGWIRPNDYPSRAGSVLGGFVKTPPKARHGIEWAVPVGELRDAGLPDPRLFLALDERGHALPLPPGAAAMTPLSWYERGVHSGWLIVYVTPTGREYAVGLGSAREVITNASKLPRLRAVRNVRHCVSNTRDINTQSPLMAWQPMGQDTWEIVLTDSLLPMVTARPGEALTTYDAVVARWKAIDLEHKASIAAEVQAQKDRKDREAAYQLARAEEALAKARTFALTKLPELIAGGHWGSARRAAAMGGAKERAMVLEHFGAWDPMELTEAERAGVPQHVIERARAKMESRLAASKRREEARLVEDKDKGLSFVEGLRAFFDALGSFRSDNLSGGGSGGDSVIDQVRSRYRENLERYNRGQQNWKDAAPFSGL